jgi:hypothetical protein
MDASAFGSLVLEKPLAVVGVVLVEPVDVADIETVEVFAIRPRQALDELDENAVRALRAEEELLEPRAGVVFVSEALVFTFIVVSSLQIG